MLLRRCQTLGFTRYAFQVLERSGASIKERAVGDLRLYFNIAANRSLIEMGSVSVKLHSSPRTVTSIEAISGFLQKYFTHGGTHLNIPYTENTNISYTELLISSIII